MKIDLLLVSGLLCVAAASSRAQQDDSARAALLARMGVERSGADFVYTGPAGRAVLSPADARKLDDFAATLEAGADPDAALVRIDLRELDDEVRAPGSPSDDGTTWLAQTPDGWRLTDAGRRAVPGILLKNPAAASVATTASAPKPLDLSLPASRIDAIVAASGNPSFDGSSSNAADLPDAPVPSATLRPATGLKPPAKPQESKLEKDLFWSSWYGYHAAFVADFTTTGMVIGKGGYETDHLYTQFGNKNMAGVIGSAVVVHAVASIASLELHRQALKRHGVWRAALETAAIGIDGYGVGVHTWGAAHNVGVLDNWNR